MLTVFNAPALRLAMSDSMGKAGQEDYLNDLRTDARQSLAALIARLGIEQAEKVPPWHIVPRGLEGWPVSRNSGGMISHIDPPSDLRLRIRIQFGDQMMGPGKAELLERIARTGSIAAAGREMGMSYKRAWMLIETLNTMFRAPVVDSTRGGPGGGGAVLTETGQQVLTLYRRVEAQAAAAAAGNLAGMQALLRDIPDGK
ncbi:LysR family transcriptional regulator [Pseudotabrizicola sp. 4114]|uniref:winged helix-turn-helix domain-containing protein n=1 Tax=Pseudotabrizicola sp. 4114 TaxID=2817731 RepID=UPI00285D1DFB|nr:molybdate transport repressor ModE-like protein [Pseudorhodobacter sp. 4114]